MKKINFNKYTLDRAITLITMNIFIIFNRYGKTLYTIIIFYVKNYLNNIYFI